MMAKSFRELKAKMSSERLEKIEDQVQTLLMSMTLDELRQTRRLTQQELANTLGINQVDWTQIETQTDMRVSTLRKLLSAMGGTLKIVAEFPDGEVIINQFERV